MLRNSLENSMRLEQLSSRTMNDATFGQKLISVFKDNKYDRFVSGQRTGKLDNKRIYRIGLSERVFKRKVERKGKHYNVSLLVDSSGSMLKGRVRPTIEATRMLSKHLISVGVNLEIVGFNTFDKHLKSFDQNTVDFKEIEQEIRHLTCDDDEFEYNERYQGCFDRQTKQLFPHGHPQWKDEDDYPGVDNYHICQGNCDGKTVYEATQRLRQMKGEKIIIILSDGRPQFDNGGFNWWCHDRRGKKYSDFDLKHEVKKAIREGIVFIGVGIETDCVREYYPEKNTVVVDNVSKDLYPEIIKKFSTLLKRA